MSRRLLFLAPSAYALGGVADWLDYLLPGLEQKGWRCTLGLTTGRFHNAESYLLVHPWKKVVAIDCATGSREGRIKAIEAALRRTQPDIVVVVNVADAYEAVRRMRLRNEALPRMVVTLHGLQGDLLADVGSEASVVDGVIATNMLTHRLAGQSLGAADRVFYAPYGVQIQEPVRRTCVSASSIRLLYCGRLEQDQKRILDLPSVLANLRRERVDVHLSIAGGGPDESLLRRALAAHDLESNVSFLGILSPRALASAYQRHDALIVTSSWETGPIVAWEAMSHGLPVVSSKYVGSGLEGALVDDVNCLLFAVGDMLEASSKVKRLLDPEIGVRLAESGLDLVRCRYNRDISIRHWSFALDRVAALPTRPMPLRGTRIPPSGRLDRLLGVRAGERLRSALGRSYRHTSAGGEWPHTLHENLDQRAWLARASEVDC